MKSRQQIGQEILDICSGQTTEESLCGQADALATAVGGIAAMNGMSLSQAGRVLDELHRSMQQHLIQNWNQIERGGRA